MSPDIEWRVGEDAEQEIIAQTSSSRWSRRRLWAVIMAIGLGVGLGWLYRSIPEPHAQPGAPTPVPTIVQPRRSPLPPTPGPFDEALQRDALRLATSTHEITFNPALNQMPQAYAEWYAALQNAYGTWGTTTSQALFAVFQTGTLSPGTAWADLAQLRNGDLFRQTRFYRWLNNRWQWTLPDWSFWKGTIETATTHVRNPIGPITLEHPIEDAPVVGIVLDRFTRTYLTLCQSLKCLPSNDSLNLWPPSFKLNIRIEPVITAPVVQENKGTLDLMLPSPRVVGYYEDARTLGDPYVAMSYATLIGPVVRLASGAYARWENDQRGELFLQAIVRWKEARVRKDLHPLELFYPPVFLPPAVTRLPDGQPVSQRDYYVDLLRNKSLLPLAEVWNQDYPTQTQELQSSVAHDEAESVIIFIEDRFGEEGVVQFLNALGRAHTLQEAVEAGLPLQFAEFNRQWQAWVAGK